jgi:hypothetical protein
MKKTRLLEIIREEIAGALNEAGLGDQIAALQKQKDALEKQEAPLTKRKADISKKIADLEKKQADAEVKSSNTLEEETLNEKPDFGGRYDQQVASKYGEEDTLQQAVDEIVDRVLRDRGLTKAEAVKLEKEDLKNLLKAIRTQVSGKNQDVRVKHALEKQQEFDDSGSKLQDNQTNNAILKSLGAITPSTRGRKAKPNKPEKPASTGTKGRPAGTKKATLTPGDDGFDKVTYSDEEVEDTYYNDEDEFSTTDTEGPSSKDISGDETAKELGSTPEEKKAKFNQFLASVKKNKEDKAKIDGILKLAKEKIKFPKSMMDDLKRAAGRSVE